MTTSTGTLYGSDATMVNQSNNCSNIIYSYGSSSSIGRFTIPVSTIKSKVTVPSGAVNVSYKLTIHCKSEYNGVTNNSGCSVILTSSYTPTTTIVAQLINGTGSQSIKTILSSTTVSSSSYVDLETDSVSNSTLNEFGDLRVDISGNTSACYCVAYIERILVTVTYTVCNTVATALVLSGTEYVSSVTLSQPQTVSVKGSIACSDTTCGSVTIANWAWYKGSTVEEYGDTGTSWTKQFDVTEAATYYFKTAGRCASLGNANATATIILNSAIRSYGVSFDGGSTWYSPQEGTTYRTDSPRNATIKFNDTWGGYYYLYIGYKKSTESAYTWSSSRSTEFIKEVSLAQGYTYDIQLAYGTSSSKTTYVSFHLAVRDPETSGYIKINSGSYSSVSSGNSYPIEVVTQSSTTVGFKYTNSYGSSEYILRIYIDNSLVGTSTTTEATCSKTYSSNGNHTVSYRYYNGVNEYTTMTFTISVMGIFINTNARITVDGTAIWTNVSKNVAQFGEQPIVITGLTGLDLAGTVYSWVVTQWNGSALSSTDYTISSSTTQSPTIKFNNSSYKYRLTCNISYTYQYGSSAGSTVSVTTLTFGPDIQTYSTMGYVTCSGQTIAKIQSMNRHEGDMTTNFEVFGKTIKPTASGDVTINGVWSIKQGTTTLTEGTHYTKLEDPEIPSGSTANCSFGFRMNINGEFTVHLTTETVPSYTSGSDDEDFKVFNITVMELPMETRHSIVLYNDIYTCVLNRRSDDDHTTIFDQLQFSSGLNKVGSASFNVIGGNNLKCYVLNTSSSTYVQQDASASLLNNNTKVIVMDNDCPIWTGIVTSVDQVNVNFYNALVNTSIVKITCSESLKELSYIYTSPSVYSGTISEISEDLLGDYAGEIGSTNTTYSISFDVSSILSALDSISSQVGWRYRCRPYIGSYGNSFIKSGNTYSVTHGKVSVGDYIIIYDGTLTPTTSHPYAYGEGYYHVGKVRTVTSGSATDTITFTSYQSLPSSNGTYKFSTCKGFLVDFKPAYYQEYVPMSYKINDVAQNVNAIDTSSDKFGMVSIYGVGNSGETISSTMKAWMTINKDYTIPYSARITKSYDSTIDSISMTQQYKAYYQSVTEYVYSEFTVTLNGWSFPTDLALISSHQPTIFYKSGSNIRSMVLSNPNTLTINRFTDQSGMNKTSVTCAYPVTMGDGSAISSSDRYARDLDGRLYADILSSLASQTNVIFNIYKVDAGDYVVTDVLTTGSIRIGDSEATCTGITSTGSLTINWITSSTMPHGHMTDTLVMDNTGNKYPSGCTYSSPAIDSPFAKYPNVKKTIQGAEGYSAMELERLACRYMQYGSNYDSEGSADIIYNEFNRSDYEVGCIRTPSVGDRIQFEKVINVTTSGPEYNLLNFELVSYDINLSSNIASVTFGMPLVEINDILYNMLSNAGMSIIPATTD